MCEWPVVAYAASLWLVDELLARAYRGDALGRRRLGGSAQKMAAGTDGEVNDNETSPQSPLSSAIFGGPPWPRPGPESLAVLPPAKHGIAYDALGSGRSFGAAGQTLRKWPAALTAHYGRWSLRTANLPSDHRSELHSEAAATGQEKKGSAVSRSRLGAGFCFGNGKSSDTAENWG